MPSPSVGRIVHYVSYGTPVRPDGSQAFTGECRAAIVTEPPPASLDDGYGGTVENEDQTIGLAVLNPTGLFFHPVSAGGCAHDEDNHQGGTWHWPERVD